MTSLQQRWKVTRYKQSAFIHTHSWKNNKIIMLCPCIHQSLLCPNSLVLPDLFIIFIFLHKTEFERYYWIKRVSLWRQPVEISIATTELLLNRCVYIIILTMNSALINPFDLATEVYKLESCVVFRVKTAIESFSLISPSALLSSQQARLETQMWRKEHHVLFQAEAFPLNPGSGVPNIPPPLQPR